MPTYQYACTECGERTEMVQKFSDAPLTVCPACGGRLRKVFSPVGIVFKGSGFYRTDSRSGNGSLTGTKEKAGESSVSASESSPAAGSGSGGPDSNGSGSGDKKAAVSPSASPNGSASSAGSSRSPGSGEKVA
ncbi:MAG TPA: FmdB family zinc ribbon protein [Streptosporangiaceae bacterium]|nr:FmdB family zinc ribbon protein [Streptosporangiaceae bacterium]